jgi:adenylosuccinate lyase
MKVWSGGGQLLDLLKQDKDVTAKLPAEKLEPLFDMAFHTKHVDTIFKRVFDAT